MKWDFQKLTVFWEQEGGIKMDRKKLNWLFSLVVMVGVFCTVSSALAGTPGLPAIYEASVANGLLTISGQNFGMTPYSVLLGNIKLTVNTWSGTQIVATLPPDATPGTYPLVVYTGKVLPFAVMAVTIGAQGLQGPQGPQGPIGATGPQGLKGDTGAQGPQGVPGSAGPQGAAGAAGAQGAAGIKGDTGPQGPIGLTGPQGTKGDTGPTGAQGLTWQGAWSNTTTYALHDAVSFNGSSYVSLGGSNTGSQPDANPSSLWSMLSLKGDIGPQGEQGLTGPQGATGAGGLPDLRERRGTLASKGRSDQ